MIIKIDEDFFSDLLGENPPIGILSYVEVDGVVYHNKTVESIWEDEDGNKVETSIFGGVLHELTIRKESSLYEAICSMYLIEE